MKTSDNWQLSTVKEGPNWKFWMLPPPPPPPPPGRGGGVMGGVGWSPSKMGSTKNFHICFLWILWSAWILSRSVLTPPPPPLIRGGGGGGDIRQKWGQPRIFRFASSDFYKVFGYCLEQFYPPPPPPKVRDLGKMQSISSTLLLKHIYFNSKCWCTVEENFRLKWPLRKT